MEVFGKIIVLNDTETVGTNGFEKRLVVIETEEQYPQKIPVDFVQGKVNLLDNFLIGEEVKIYANVRGNEYNGKYYIQLQGWKIEKK